MSSLTTPCAKAQYANWLKHSTNSTALKCPVLRMYADSSIAKFPCACTASEVMPYSASFR
ncbi:Uncharacterised protein [Mycobacteroides abscessus subsp. abscessus]|nr:Uncharacterised protein [Mycobacteroides abscessus subsp. abscessus]SHW66752.1 Uncharacterised protein [Mycobacteroides abscessus subsp. abscessus]